MRVLCSVSCTVRIALWALTLGFVLGGLTGYRFETAPDEPATIVIEDLDDVRSIARICQTEIGCVHTVLVILGNLLIAIAG